MNPTISRPIVGLTNRTGSPVTYRINAIKSEIHACKTMTYWMLDDKRVLCNSCFLGCLFVPHSLDFANRSGRMADHETFKCLTEAGRKCLVCMGLSISRLVFRMCVERKNVLTSEEKAVSPPPLSGFSSTQKNVVEGGCISHVWLSLNNVSYRMVVGSKKGILTRCAKGHRLYGAQGGLGCFL